MAQIKPIRLDQVIRLATESKDIQPGEKPSKFIKRILADSKKKK
jgi:hypothetical protein